MTDLFYLVRLRFTTFGLLVQDFLDSFFEEDVVATFGSLCETQSEQQSPQVRETDVGVGSATQN